jgi:hypothetical protein
VERLRESLQEIGSQKVLAGAIVFLALSLLALSLAVVWYGLLSSRQEAEQAAREEENRAPPAPRPEDFPLIFDSRASPELTDAISAAARRSRGIPGLSEMDLVGNLRYLPGTNFSCPGAEPDQGLYKRTCRSSRKADPAVYEVTLVEKDPSIVLSVQATARDASDEAATEVLGRVAELSLKGAAPIDARSWVGRNIESGGQYFADGVEARLYGTEGARTLEIVASTTPATRSPETTERTTNRPPR